MMVTIYGELNYSEEKHESNVPGVMLSSNGLIFTNPSSQIDNLSVSFSQNKIAMGPNLVIENEDSKKDAIKQLESYKSLANMSPSGQLTFKSDDESTLFQINGPDDIDRLIAHINQKVLFVVSRTSRLAI